MIGKERKLAKKFDVIRLYKDDVTERKIAQDTQIPKSTVHNIIDKYNKHDTVMRLSGSGRNKALSNEDIKFLVKSAEDDPKKSSVRLASELNDAKGKIVTCRTIQNVLKESGFNCRVPRRLPLLSQKTFLIGYN